MVQVLKTGDRLRTCLIGSETVVRVEGTQRCIACRPSIGRPTRSGVKGLSGKVHACGESGCTSVTLAEHPHHY